MLVLGMTYPVVPLYLVDAGVGPFLAGAVVALSSLAGFLSQVAWGALSDRLGRRGTFIALGGLLMAACYLTAAAQSGNLLLLSALYVAASVGSAAVLTPSSALAADAASSGEVGRAMGLFWAGGSLGWALPLVFAGRVLESWGIGPILAASGCVSLCIAAVGALAADAGGAWRGEARARPWRLLLRPRFLLVYLATLAFYMGDVVKNIYVPQFHAYELGLGEAWATAILSTASWAEVPLLLLFGLLTDRLGGWRVFTFSLGAAAAYMLANALVSDLTTAVAVMASYGVVWSSFSSSSSAIAVEVSREGERGTALGMLNANFSLANIAAPLIFGYAVEAWGYRACFKLAAAPLAAAAAAVAVAGALRRR